MLLTVVFSRITGIKSFRSTSVFAVVVNGPSTPTCVEMTTCYGTLKFVDVRFRLQNLGKFWSHEIDWMEMILLFKFVAIDKYKYNNSYRVGNYFMPFLCQFFDV